MVGFSTVGGKKMGFTTGEMLCFNSLLDGKKVYGITFDYDSDCDEKIFIQETLESLREKELLTDAYKLTEKGAVMVKILEEYKKSATYLTVNNTFIASIDSKYGVVINCPVEGGREKYLMTALSKKEIIDYLLESRPDIGNKYRKYKISSKIEFDGQELYEDLVKYESDKIIYIKKEKNNQVELERIYYWDDKQGYFYECREQIRVEMEPGEICGILCEMLEIEGV